MPRQKSSVLKRGAERAATRTTTITNNKQVKKQLEPKTEENYDNDVKLWAEWIEGHPNASLENFESPKDFLLNIALGMEGRFNIKEPSQKWILQHWKNLTAGIRRDGRPVNPEVVNSTSEWIKGELTRELNLPLRKIKRRYGTMNHFLNLGVQLWRDDWYTYDWPGIKVEFWTQLGMNVYNAGRAGEYVESSARAGSSRGLHFKDVVFECS